MPLLDAIATTTHLPLQTHHSKDQPLATSSSSFTPGNNANAKLFRVANANFSLRCLKMGRGRRCVAAVESKVLVQSPMFEEEEGLCKELEGLGLSGETGELDEKERLRRNRISKANKGNTPWNKGRRHSPETIWKIRERTRLAMQNPKVKMKLASLGHAQSKETKLKIGASVRMGWEKRRIRLKLQETCHFEWQNLIAESSRNGLLGQEELSWDSYRMLNEQLLKEWLLSIELRKKACKVKCDKRAPKSAEQKKRISQAISAKWNDPDYRNRVCSAMAKYYGINEQSEKKPKRKMNGKRPTRSTVLNPTDSDSPASKDKSQTLSPRPRRSKEPLYEDPLVNSKLEMIKNIRAQRATADARKTKAIEQARLLIAEAEKAANALEVAARTNPVAHASLVEARKLINEAIDSIAFINLQSPASVAVPKPPSDNSYKLTSHVRKERNSGNEQIYMTDQSQKFNISKARSESDQTCANMQDMLAGQEKLYSYFEAEKYHPPLPDIKSTSGNVIATTEPRYLSSPSPQRSKKTWIRGRLVEVKEGR